MRRDQDCRTNTMYTAYILHASPIPNSVRAVSKPPLTQILPSYTPIYWQTSELFQIPNQLLKPAIWGNLLDLLTAFFVSGKTHAPLHQMSCRLYLHIRNTYEKRSTLSVHQTRTYDIQARPANNRAIVSAKHASLLSEFHLFLPMFSCYTWHNTHAVPFFNLHQLHSFL